ncbi:unnamed protein product, partial [Menidia menidia]
VRVTQIQGMKTVINEYDVRSEILNTGMGVSNPEHLDLLRELCQEDLANSSKYVDSEFSFHPHIRWYQTCDSVIVKVKLVNPESQNFEFYPDRVTISADISRWEMISNEPVLKLVKQQPGHWDRLVRTKVCFQVHAGGGHFQKYWVVVEG